MISQISWLDFSEQERRKMIEVIQLFKEQDTRDELGIGSIRDTLAELLFPGTGTLQTRARYFLIVPWLFIKYEQHTVSSARINDRLRLEEKRLIDALKQKETDGVIGQLSGVNLHRFPSSIYWTGLRTWGILRFPSSLDQYTQSLDYYYQQKHKIGLADHDDATFETQFINWDPDIPAPPSSFPIEADFKLSYQEAIYLKERLQLSCADSLLAHLVRETKPVEGIKFPWAHPSLAHFPNPLANLIVDAQNFSDTMWGAMLLYNYLLAKKKGIDEKVDQYETEIIEWTELINSRKKAFSMWDINQFWQTLHHAGRIPENTMAFVNRWLELVLGNNKDIRIIENNPAMTLIRNREYQLKRSRSRFENLRRLEVWSGRSGTAQLNYRWPVASRIVNDILNGLQGN